MPLPTRADVQTLDYSLGAQPAVLLDAKALGSGTLDYSLQAQPAYGLSAVSDVTLTQTSRFDNTNTFYSAAITPGAVTLLPALFTNANTFYSATLVATYNLAPALFTNTNTFYSATITPGTAPLIETERLDNVNTFYAATVVPGPIGLFPDIFTNVNVVYSPSAYVFTILQPPLLVDPDTFFDAVLTGGSPVPIPYHPFCGRGSLTITEAPRNNMAVTTLPRKSLTPSC